MSDDPRVTLLEDLKTRDYRFTAVTPATHRIVLSRPFAGPPKLEDVFGWNRPFAEPQLDPLLFGLLNEAGLLSKSVGLLRSAVRVASLGDELFLHSAFPTDGEDAVFFGPDTYRFARFLRQHLSRLAPGARIIDMGAGSGAGGIMAARMMSQGCVTLVDSNPVALDFARVNAAAAGVEVTTIQSRTIPPGGDVVIANPPYMMDARKRAYRDGGQLLGGGVAVDWVEQAIGQLKPGGTMLLYTGAAFSSGTCPLVESLQQICSRTGTALSIEEIDPDVFGDELVEPAYVEVDRIAALGIVLTTRVPPTGLSP